jgi:hypothetical protein
VVRAALLIALLLPAPAAVLAGCGGDGSTSSGSGSPPPAERADARPKLPVAWKRLVNQEAGFSLGLPPGWTGRGANGTTLVRSADRALAIAISADRSDDGRSGPLAQYARRTLASLPGYTKLHAGPDRKLTGTKYPGVVVRGSGTFRKTKVRQAIQVFALRRDKAVTFTLIVFRSAEAPEATYAPALRIMLRTFRGQPPAF